MRNYKKLFIWQKGMVIVEKTYRMVKSLPDEEKYGLRSQATRAAVSIVLNIAEGSAKTRKKDYKKYLETSLGSAFELETLLLVVERLKLVNRESTVDILDEIIEEQRMITSFIEKIGRDSQ
ncbi:four helix bundle protein [Pseudochryseolinea flava]|uniref:Diversity-generating retroelement protein bAvd family protein n=1 Tax=Pseudochryseolinea flava TaxID=2059302 RepID=A0A364XY46_9BACT|nr:four helix bundle protein [Pseudochryseolinea flava]RAV98349.1 diversity-generating retroelement protein bAvd family protein [Pseudochryseolinea flava]